MPRPARPTAGWWREALVTSSSTPSTEQRGGGLQHLVGGADDLGVHFISALRGDQVGHLGGDVDIGLLEASLRDGAVAFGAGKTILRRAGRRGIGEQVAADRRQAGLVDESRQADLADDR